MKQKQHTGGDRQPGQDRDGSQRNQQGQTQQQGGQNHGTQGTRDGEPYTNPEEGKHQKGQDQKEGGPKKDKVGADSK